MRERSETLGGSGQHPEVWTTRESRIKHIHGTDPLGLFIISERPPFSSDPRVLAFTVGDDNGHEDGEKHNASDAEEESHR